MKANIKKISDRIDELTTAKRDKETKWRETVKTTKSRVKAIEEALNDTADIETYQQLATEKRDCENFLAQLEKRKPNHFAPSIDKDEYKSIRNELDAEIDDVKKAYVGEIAKKVYELVKVLDEYSDEVFEINNVRQDASFLFKGIPGTSDDLFDVSDKCNDPLKYCEKLTRAYFNHRVTVKTIERDIENGKSISICGDGVAEIATTLKKRLSHGK